MKIGTQVFVKDDNGKKHAATITAVRSLLGPFRSYTVVIEDSGQILDLAPQFFTVTK
jgi:hypothetical protein